MGQPLERLIVGYRANGLNAQADKLANNLADFRKDPGFPEDLRVKSQGETLSKGDLERAIKEQVGRYIALDFHKEVYLNLSEEEAKAKYLADFTLPEGAVKPAEYTGRFDIPLAVEPRISLSRKHELAKRMKELNLDNVVKKWRTSQVAEWINTGKIKDLTPHPTDGPYLVFTHPGEKYRPYSVEKALIQFASDEVGSSQLEVTDLFLQHPDFFDGRGIDAAGSRYERGSVPYLGTFYGRPGVYAFFIGSPAQDWGAGSRGKEIIRLGV